MLLNLIESSNKYEIHSSVRNMEKLLKPNELIKWYEKVIDSYTYQLNSPRTPPYESAELLQRRITLATPTDSFLSPAIGLKNIWTSPSPNTPFTEFDQPEYLLLPLWKFSFQELVRSPVGIKNFYDFLNSEFSSENLAFYLECKELEKIFYYDAFVEKALIIYNEFIAPGSPREINIVSSLRQNISTSIEYYLTNKVKLKRNIFEAAVASVLNLMSTDSYFRFCNSELLKDKCKPQVSLNNKIRKTNPKVFIDLANNTALPNPTPQS